jgi:hypothetical protein
MAVGDYPIAPFTSPVGLDRAAFETRGNDNVLRDKFVDHQADEVAHLQSGVAASRPASGTVTGETYLATDTGVLSVWSGSAWVENKTGSGDVVGDDTSTTVQNIVAYNTTGGKNITELTGTQGDVLYHNGTSWQKLPAGTSGQFLKTNGAGANPAWAAAGGGTGDVVGDDTTTTVQNIVAYNTTGGKNITELTGTQGDVLYHNGTSWAKLGAGTAGQVLRTNGAGANPDWWTPADPTGYTYIVKPTSQDVTNAGLTNDTNFSFAVAANNRYMLTMDLVIAGNNTTGDFTMDFNLSAGTMKGRGNVQNLTAAEAIQNVIITAAGTANTTAIVTGTPADLDTLIAVRIQYAFLCTSAGTLTFRFGNAAAAAGRTSRVYKGSILAYKNIT